MSLTLATALVAATVTLPSCSWDRPGADPYMGDIEAAVDRYRDIPADVRARLKARVRQRAYDDIATITRDKIEGKRSYSNLRDMHFGNGRVCRQVGRTKWKPEAVERGLIYCEGEHCLIIPTVCRNVSRVTPEAAIERKSASVAEEETIDPPSSAGANMLGGQRFVDEGNPLPARTLSLEPPPGELSFDPPGGVEPPAPPELPREPLPDPSPPIPPPPIPEPSTWVLMALGLAVVVRQARRRTRTAP